MYGPRYEPPPIEKIRKQVWSAENTAKTQVVVDNLKAIHDAHLLIGAPVGMVAVLKAAIARFAELDRNVDAGGVP